MICSQGVGFDGVMTVENGYVGAWEYLWGGDTRKSGWKGLLGAMRVVLEEEIMYNGIICGCGDGFGEVIVVEKVVGNRGGGF